MTFEQFSFSCYDRSAFFFSRYVPCKFLFYIVTFSEGEVGGLKLGLCVSP